MGGFAVPVAKNQLTEVVVIFREYLNDTELLELTKKLKKTVAYKRNRSFAVTIDRIREALR